MRPSVTLVVGLSALAKRDLVAAWRASAPFPVGLLIDQGEDVKFASRASAPGDSPAYTQFLSGCACCTGRAGLARALSQLLRQGPYTHLIVELNAGAHPAVFIDLLDTEPLATQITLKQTVTVIDAEHLAPQATKRLRDWVIEQAEASDRVILRCARTLGAQARQAHEALLAQWCSFEPAVQWWVPDLPMPVFEPAAGARRARAHPMMVALAQRPAAWRWRWQAEPLRVLDRRGVMEALAPWLSKPRVQVRAALRTEREWYGLQAGAWAPTLWRGENRIEIDYEATDHSEIALQLTLLAKRLVCSELLPGQSLESPAV